MMARRASRSSWMFDSDLARLSEAVTRSISTRLKSPESIAGFVPEATAGACHPPGGVRSDVVVFKEGVAGCARPADLRLRVVVVVFVIFGPLAPTFSSGEGIFSPWKSVTDFFFSSGGPTYPGPGVEGAPPGGVNMVVDFCLGCGGPTYPGLAGGVTAAAAGTISGAVFAPKPP